ncbi:hypothetical protein EW145_g3743 [Phellinidium pouzarii]|uniref:Pectinesterase n=1 Tax=Phellinidium pouzarii TaxID=167371 RepID=A0A4S4L687_9AGAM|nr:hypothetical protein EW145_g3743 [Phellinidium pouzarii]
MHNIALHAYCSALSLKMLWLPAVLVWLAQSVHAASMTLPPSGAIVVRTGTRAPGEFTSIASAIASLPDDASSQSIFVFPGTYTERVLIDRPGAVSVYGYTMNTMSYSMNQVVLTHSASLGTAGSDDASGTLRIKSDNVALYNIDVRNDFGVSETNGQAIALSNYDAQAYFEGNTIASKGAGCVTAYGRPDASDPSPEFIPTRNYISYAFSNVTGNIPLDYARY